MTPASIDFKESTLGNTIEIIKEAFGVLSSESLEFDNIRFRKYLPFQEMITKEWVPFTEHYEDRLQWYVELSKKTENMSTTYRLSLTGTKDSYETSVIQEIISITVPVNAVFKLPEESFIRICSQFVEEIKTPKE